MLADPAEARIPRKRLLEHRRSVDECAVAEVADPLFDPRREALQALAHELVIVAAERVSGDVAERGIFQHLLRGSRVSGLIVHADRNDAQRAGDELGGPRPKSAVSLHVVHCAMTALLEPALEALFVFGELHGRDADSLKPELKAPAPDFAGELGELV